MKKYRIKYLDEDGCLSSYILEDFNLLIALARFMAIHRDVTVLEIGEIGVGNVKA